MLPLRHPARRIPSPCFLLSGFLHFSPHITCPTPSIPTPSWPFHTLGTHRNGHGWGNKRYWRGYGHRTCPRRSAGTPLSCLRTSSWRKVRSGHSAPGIIWCMPAHMLTGGHLTRRGHGYRGKHDSWLNFIGKCQHRWRQCMRRGRGASAGANFKGMISRRVQDCTSLQCRSLQFHARSFLTDRDIYSRKVCQRW